MTHQPELRRGAIGLREVLFQSITAMAPGAAIAASIPVRCRVRRRRPAAGRARRARGLPVRRALHLRTGQAPAGGRVRRHLLQSRLAPDGRIPGGVGISVRRGARPDPAPAPARLHRPPARSTPSGTAIRPICGGPGPSSGPCYRDRRVLRRPCVGRRRHDSRCVRDHRVPRAGRVDDREGRWGQHGLRVRDVAHTRVPTPGSPVSSRVPSTPCSRSPGSRPPRRWPRRPRTPGARSARPSSAPRSASAAIYIFTTYAADVFVGTGQVRAVRHLRRAVLGGRGTGLVRACSGCWCSSRSSTPPSPTPTPARTCRPAPLTRWAGSASCPVVRPRHPAHRSPVVAVGVQFASPSS